MRFKAPIAAVAVVVASLTAVAPAGAHHDEGPLWASHILEPGFAATPFTMSSAPLAAMAFGPDGHLYTASYGGLVERHRVVGRVVAGAPEIVISGLDRPLGLAIGADGSLYVSSVDTGHPQVGRPWGMVTRFRPGVLPLVASEGERILVDVPNGVHTLSGIALGPDERLYVGVASTSVNGDSPPGEAPEVEPITMAILRLPIDVGRPLSALHDLASGAEGDHEVEVVATGIHNPHDLAFRGDDLYTASNAPQGQEPLGEDVVLRVADAPSKEFSSGTADSFGSPGCLYTHDENGWPLGGASTYPSLPNEEKTCEGRVRPAAVLGLHRGATGIAVAPGGFASGHGDVFVAEWGSLFPPVRGHKVVRIALNEDGTVATTPGGRPSITDFLATPSPIDVAFHDGALYVADFASGAVIRVIAAG